MKRPYLCIAGKNNIAVDVLNYCINNYDDLNIVCIPNKGTPDYNGWQKSLKWFAKNNNIDIVTLEDVYDIEGLIFLSLEFDRIIDTKRFKSNKLFNIHFSLLPKYKGCHTSVLPILFGDSDTGVTLHCIRDGIDTGEIIAQRKFEVSLKDTSYNVYNKLIKTGTDLVIDNLSLLISGEYQTFKQESINSSYYSSDYIDYSNIQLNIKCTAYQIYNQIRAFCFKPYQLIKWNGVEYIDSCITDSISGFKPGTILEDNELYTKICSIDYDIVMYKNVYDQIVDYIKEGFVDKVDYYSKTDIIINLLDDKGRSIITYAVIMNQFDIVHLLYSKGGNSFVKDFDGANLLFYSIEPSLKTGDWTTFSFLIENGLNSKEMDYFNRSIWDNIDMNKVPAYIKKLV